MSLYLLLLLLRRNNGSVQEALCRASARAYSVTLTDVAAAQAGRRLWPADRDSNFVWAKRTAAPSRARFPRQQNAPSLSLSLSLLIRLKRAKNVCHQRLSCSIQSKRTFMHMQMSPFRTGTAIFSPSRHMADWAVCVRLGFLSLSLSLSISLLLYCFAFFLSDSLSFRVSSESGDRTQTG